MTLPTFDAKLHDVNLGGYGWMVVRGQQGEASIIRQDATPATNRSATGESQNDRWAIDAFYAQTDFSGGAGQHYLEAKDRYAVAWGDARFQGHVFPPKKKLTVSDGAIQTWGVAYGSHLYGFTNTTVEEVGTASSQALGGSTALICKPKVTASANIIFIQGTAVYRWNRVFGTAPVDVTPFAGMTPTVVERYGHHIWVLGTITISASIALIQTVLYQGIAPALNHSVSIPTPRPGNLLLAQINYTDAAATAPTTIAGDWTFIRRDVSSLNSVYMEFWYKRAQSTDRSLSVRENTAAAVDLSVIVTEWSGIDVDALLDQQDTNTGSGSSTLTSPTVTTNDANELLYLGYNQNVSANQSYASYTNSFTEITEGTSSSLAHSPGAAYRIVSATSSYSTSFNSSGSTQNWVTTLLTFRKNSLSVDITQFAVFFTTDDGASWTQAFNTDGASGIPPAIASRAAMGKLWFTTAEGLYALEADEQQYVDQVAPVLVAVNGPYDVAVVPKDVTNIGQWVDVYDGIVYWTLGATVRRYAPNGLGEAIWPSKNWGTVAGKVQALVAGEGGVWWGAAGSLWNYDGTVVHQMAREVTTGDFDYLTWHAGRLYFKGDPANYLDYGYPAMRPDLFDLTATTYETGYLVTSAFDFGKVNIPKIVSSLGLYAEFSVAGSASGSLTLEYCNLDTGIHPERYAPNSSTPTWVNVGTLASSEGVNVKHFNLSPPLDTTKVMFRVTLTPGASGISILEGVLADGETIMPRLLRFPMTLSLATGTVNKAGGLMYRTAAAVEEALTQLQTWRTAASAPRYFSVGYLNGVNDPITYPVCIAEQLTDWLERMDGDGNAATTFVGYTAQFIARQVPQ